MGKLLPQSHRVRLIFSFGLIIFLTLSLAGVATVYLLRDQQERNARERIGVLADPIGRLAALVEFQGGTVRDIQAVLVNEYSHHGIRILLVHAESARVVADSGGSLMGTNVGEITDARMSDSSKYRVHEFKQDGHENLLFFAPPQFGYSGPDGRILRPQYRAIIAVEASDISQAWRDLLPRLFLAGGIASLVAVLAAGLLARSISRPLRHITAASEEMARGRYDQQLPDYGGGEVGRLARAFNDMARQVGTSHRTLRDFLANVSHELKTPLTSIQGFSQAMTDGSLTRPEDFAEAGRIINDEAVRMRGLVEDLLYLSQVERGEFKMHLHEVSPNELLQETWERFSRRAANANVDLSVEAGDTPNIDADGRRLEQALANIVDNAIRHTPGGGSVTLSSDAAGGRVYLSVHNTGSVIPGEALPHVFERF